MRNESFRMRDAMVAIESIRKRQGLLIPRAKGRTTELKESSDNIKKRNTPKTKKLVE